MGRPCSTQTKVASALRKAGRVGMSPSELIQACYGDREDGGPLSADNCIQQAIHALKAKGLDIEAVTVYRIKSLGGLTHDEKESAAN